MVLFLFQVPSRTLHEVSWHVPFDSSWLVRKKFLRLFLALDDRYSWGAHWSGILYDFPKHGFIWCFSVITLGCRFWGGDPPRESAPPITSHQGHISPTWCHLQCSLWSPGWGHVFRCLCCEITLFPFPCCVLWKEATMPSPHLGDRKPYAPPPGRWSIYINYLNFSTEETCLFSPFIYLFSPFFIPDSWIYFLL